MSKEKEIGGYTVSIISAGSDSIKFAIARRGGKTIFVRWSYDKRAWIDSNRGREYLDIRFRGKIQAAFGL
jgi:hypothetical protein